MDCVGCDKCRLWGKVQTAGYGTALKVLFEFDNNSEDIPYLKRTELVALFNTHARLGESLNSVGKFRQMLVDGEIVDDAAVEPEEILEEDEPEPVVKPRKKLRAKASLKEQFIHEVELFSAAIQVVLRSWYDFPKTL
jgi:hypothetical protein